jgi:hypothetical protein
MTDKYEDNRTIVKARKMVETVFNKKTVKKKKNNEKFVKSFFRKIVQFIL